MSNGFHAGAKTLTSEYDAKHASQLAFLFSKLGFTGVLQQSQAGDASYYFFCAVFK